MATQGVLRNLVVSKTSHVQPPSFPTGTVGLLRLYCHVGTLNCYTTNGGFLCLRIRSRPLYYCISSNDVHRDDHTRSGISMVQPTGTSYTISVSSSRVGPAIHVQVIHSNIRCYIPLVPQLDAAVAFVLGLGASRVGTFDTNLELLLFDYEHLRLFLLPFGQRNQRGRRSQTPSASAKKYRHSCVVGVTHCAARERGE